MARVQAQRTGSATRSASKTASTNVKVSADVLARDVEGNQTLPKECSLCKLGSYAEARLLAITSDLKISVMGTCFQDLVRQQSTQTCYMDFSKFPPEYISYCLILKKTEYQSCGLELPED